MSIGSGIAIAAMWGTAALIAVFADPVAGGFVALLALAGTFRVAI